MNWPWIMRQARRTNKMALSLARIRQFTGRGWPEAAVDEAQRETSEGSRSI
jgi:hypothetical protein